MSAGTKMRTLTGYRLTPRGEAQAAEAKVDRRAREAGGSVALLAIPVALAGRVGWGHAPMADPREVRR